MIFASISRNLLPLFFAFSLLADTACDSGLPNCSSRTWCDSNNPYIFTDVLFWRAEEGATTWADTVHVEPKTFYNQSDLSFGWNFGFRGGVGYNLDYDQWDTKIVYTWFRTEANDAFTLSPSDVAVISSEFLGAFLELPRTIFGSASISWSILFNMFDWELGRDFLVSRALSLRPFIGVKGGWIHQTIHTRWANPLSLRAQENLKNNFWGVGPCGGLNTDWRLGGNQTRFFSLFGDVSGAYMWGKWNCSDVYSDNFPGNVIVITPSTFLGSLTFRCFAGIGWSTLFNQNRSRFAARIGYEMQFWFDQLKIATFDNLRLHHDLTLQGGTCDIRFDF